MKTSHFARFSTLACACVAAACSCSSSNTHGSGSDGGIAGLNTVNGIVNDIGTGAPLSGAMVSGGGKTATTDAEGTFSLMGLPAGSVSLSISKDGYAPGYANSVSGTKPDVVIVSLKQQGALQPWSGGTSATLSERTEAGPYALILAPNSLDTTDTNLKVSITPLDPTKERQALPGSLVTGGANPSLLLPVTFAEFTVLDSSGRRLNLKPSASAIVELPIPPSLRSTYPLGTKIHCYSYDGAAGAWQDFVEGTVQTSTVDGTTPVLSATIRHFSWYGGAPQGNNCVDVYVTVVSAVDGKPLPNARVEATPGTVAYTDANGSAKVVSALGEPGSAYTAYQTGYDVDGSLTGIPGAKYIEFGEVQEDVVGLVPKSCSGAAGSLNPPGNARSQGSAVGSQDNPLVIKVALVKNLLYNATATLVAGNGAGSISVVLQQGVPGPNGKLVNPAPASGAKIYIGESGGAPVQLSELANSGVYAPSGAFPVTPGKSYTLQVDGDGSGRIGGTATIVAVGALAWVNPTDGANVAASGFTASWTDTGTTAGNAAYAPVYEATIVPIGGTTTAAIYVGTAMQFDVKTPTGDPLAPGMYSAVLIGFSGFYAAGVSGVALLTNNITGTGVTGTFFSIGTSPGGVTFTVH
jgi:hypothetical protein